MTEHTPPIEIEKKLLTVTREFLSEFKTESVLAHLNLHASIERDLGVDSLGKVELFLRIERAFGLKFEDALMIEADTLNDIAIALEKRNPSQKTAAQHFATVLGNTDLDPSTYKTLIEVLYHRVKKDPNRPHIYMQDEFGEEEILRYGQLLERATLVAQGLLEKGLRPSDTVAIMLPTGLEFFYAFFGVLLAGGIPVPIYPPLRADRIEEYAVREATILNNAEVRILITFDKVEVLSKLLRVFIKSLNIVTTVLLLQNAKGNKPLPHFHLKETDPALIQYTSGSTSDPKGVLLTHYNLLSNIKAFGTPVHIGATDVGVSWLPLYHDMGLIGAWLGSLYHAFPLTVLSPLSFLNRPERWLWAIHYHRATISGGPNFAYELCVRKIDESLIEGLDLSSWRLAFNGAEAINPKTLERFIKKFQPYGFRPETFFPVYGLAESTVALTFPPQNRPPRIDRIAREPFETEQRAVPTVHKTDTLEFVACGKPLPEHEIRIVNIQGQAVAERIVGSLQFKGPSAMQGYFKNPESTRAIQFEGWWDSGDFAYLADEEVFIVGRKKDIIIKAGRNLSPQEIEEVAAEVNFVRKGCVIAFGVNDPKRGTEKLIVVAETQETNAKARAQITAEIIEKISVVLGLPPDEVVLVPPRSIPKTSSGKLQRSLCKQYYQQGKLVRPGLPISLQLTRLYLKSRMIKLKKFWQQLAQRLYTAYVLFWAIVLLPLVLLSIHFLPARLSQGFCKKIVGLFLLLSAARIRIQGKANLTLQQPLIYVANHASYVDSILLFYLLPNKIAFVGKQELKKWPIVGKAFEKWNQLTVDRMDFSKNLSATEAILKTLKEGRSVMIFPEGTFSYAKGLRPFKMGAFKLAVDANVPICPIALKGTRSVLRGNRKLLNRSRIDMTIGKPITPQNTDWHEVTRLHGEVHDFIEKNCGEKTIDLIAAMPVIPDHPKPSHQPPKAD